MSNKNFGGLIIILTLFAFSAQSATAYWLIDRSGTLIQVNANILGEEDQREIPDVDEQVEQEQEDVREHEEERRRELDRERLERQIEARERQMEVRREEHTSKIEIQDGRMKVKQELHNENGRVIKETEVEMEDEESLRVDTNDSNEDLEINVVDGEQLEIKGNRVRTRTNFPITIGANNELIITRKDGSQKVVTVLPDTALANLERKGFETVDQEVELEETQEGTPVYRFAASREKKILGLFKIKFSSTTAISAETGEVVEETSTETSPMRRFLERFAI